MGFAEDLNNRYSKYYYGLIIWSLYCIYDISGYIIANPLSISNILHVVDYILPLYLSGAAAVMATIAFITSRDMLLVSEAHRVLDDFYKPLKSLVENIKDLGYTIDVKSINKIKRLENHKYLAKSDAGNMFVEWSEFAKKISLSEQKNIAFNGLTDNLYIKLCDDISFYENRFK